MTEPRKRSVFFVGQQDALDEMMGPVTFGSNIHLQALCLRDDCHSILSEEACDLLVFDFDSDVARVLDLLKTIGQLLPSTPKLALVGKGDVPTAVQATHAGAANCLEKPVDATRLQSEIEGLLSRAVEHPADLTSGLTPMEKIVLRHILSGQTNEQTARALHRSPRTIEIHRKHIMRKLGVANIVELVKTAISSGFFDEYRR